MHTYFYISNIHLGGDEQINSLRSDMASLREAIFEGNNSMLDLKDFFILFIFCLVKTDIKEMRKESEARFLEGILI